MVLELLFFPTDQSTSVYGQTDWWTALEHWFITMVISMKEIGKMEQDMSLESLLGAMEESLKEIGKMENNMERESL